MGAQCCAKFSKQTMTCGRRHHHSHGAGRRACAGRLSGLAAGANPVELVEGLELAVIETIAAAEALGQSPAGLRWSARSWSIAANDAALEKW